MTQGQNITLAGEIPDKLSGKRLDQALATMYPDYSRAQWQNWIKIGAVTVDGQVCTIPRVTISSSQKISVNAKLDNTNNWSPQAININIAHEDETLLIINKPAGMVVHPGAGNPKNTLANALLYYHPALSEVPRAGVIHRLDKDTSGLLLIAKTPAAYQALINLMKNRLIKREYITLVKGLLISGGKIQAPIARHPTQRTKMAVHTNGREAITHYRIQEKFTAHTLLKVQLETGRTHQIRVHMNHMHYPIVGDPVYHKAVALPAKLHPSQQIALQKMKRQALHAWRLTFPHPGHEKTIHIEAPLPEDFASLLAILRKKQ